MSDTKVIKIPATIRVCVPIDTPDSVIDGLVSLISSDTIPTLEDAADEIKLHIVGAHHGIVDQLSHLVADADVWVEDNWTED